MVRFSGLTHLHLKVSDVGRSASFYERGMGMRRLAEKHEGKMVVLFMPDRADILTISEGSIGAEAHPDSADVGVHGGFDHFGFALAEGSDLVEAAQLLREVGATYLFDQDIAPGVPSSFFRDPDGYVFQIWSLPRAALARAAEAAMR